MSNTLILVENIKERAASILGSIISYSKIEFMGKDVDYDKYSNIILMIDKERIVSEIVNINGNEKKFLDHLLDLKIKLFDKKLKVAVLFETNEVSSLNEVILPLKDSVLGIQNCIFINKDVANDAVYSAMELCETLNEDEKRVSDKENNEIIKILEYNNILNISSTVSDKIYSVNLEYIYINELIYLVSNKGELFSNIYINDSVSFSILNMESSIISKSVIGYARADVLELDSKEYMGIINNSKIGEISNSNEVDTYIIKLIPERISLVNM